MTGTPLPPVSDGIVIDMPEDPERGDFYIAENGVRYYYDGDKWMLATDTDLALWKYDRNDNTVTPVIAGVGIKATNTGTGTTDSRRTAAMQEEGYDVDILPKLKHFL